MHTFVSSIMTRRAGQRLIQAAALALLLTMAIPGRAAGERAVKTRVSPVYPELAKRMRITGVVRLEATVDPSGKVTAVKAVSGSQALAPAAQDAVSKWKYAPADAASTEEVSVNFSLGQ